MIQLTINKMSKNVQFFYGLNNPDVPVRKLDLVVAIKGTFKGDLSC